MRLLISPISKKVTSAVYLVGFIFTVHFAMLDFINSSYLGEFMPLDRIGLMYIVASLLAILVTSNLANLLSRYGHFHLTVGFVAISLVSLVGLAVIRTPLFALTLFAIHYALNIVIRTTFDLYLEKTSDTEHKGRVRGKYLTLTNLGWVASAILVTLILKDSNYWAMYFASAALAGLVLIIFLRLFRHAEGVSANYQPFWKNVGTALLNKNLSSIILARFMLNFFFAWMVIYSPIYLHETIGFSWGALGILFTIMLLPYVLFEYPLGKLADKIFGEKEFLITGFLLIAASTSLIAFIESKSFALWAIILFLTRVGASFVEAMSEIYFFRKVSTENIGAIELFRDTDPLAYVVAPLLGSILLGFINIQYLFLVLAFIALSGAFFGLRLKDTK